MKIFIFMIKKNMPHTLVISIVFALFSVIFFSNSCSDIFKNTEYENAFENASKQQAPYEYVTKNITDIQEKSSAAAQKANDYIASHQTEQEPIVVLPNEIVDELLENGQGGTMGQGSAQTYLLLENQLKAQCSYLQLIEERSRGYSRNVRRGVKDEYSLALSEKLINDYQKILNKNVTQIADTRAADALNDYLHNEFLTAVGVYALLFHIFSSEIQTKRFSSFSLTKTGARKFSKNKMLSGYAAALIFLVITYASLFFTMIIKNSGKEILSMPLQYLRGFELSSENLNIGEYFLILFALKTLYLLASASIIMLISFVSKRIIISGIFSLIPVFLPKIFAIFNFKNAFVPIFKCDIAAMTNDINYINILEMPIKIYCIFILAMFIFIVFFSAAVYLISGKRGV